MTAEPTEEFAPFDPLPLPAEAPEPAAPMVTVTDAANAATSVMKDSPMEPYPPPPAAAVVEPVEAQPPPPPPLIVDAALP